MSAPRSVDELSALLHRHFPDLQWKSARYIGEGWDHEVLILDGATVFRFPEDEEYQALLEHEIAVLHALTPLITIRVPQYSYVAPDFSCAGYPIVPGEQLTAERYHVLPVAQQHAVQAQLADFLSTLHAIDPATDGRFAVVPASYLPQDQADVKQAANKYLPTVLSDDEMNLVRHILSDVDEQLARQLPVRFIHNDIYSSHLFWDGNRLGVIDFSDMMRGDPAIDFNELHEYGTDFVAAGYEHYQGLKDSDFLDRAWRYYRWQAVYMMTDHFEYQKTSFETARQTFDRVRKGRG